MILLTAVHTAAAKTWSEWNQNQPFLGESSSPLLMLAHKYHPIPRDAVDHRWAVQGCSERCHTHPSPPPMPGPQHRSRSCHTVAGRGHVGHGKDQGSQTHHCQQESTSQITGSPSVGRPPAPELAPTHQKKFRPLVLRAQTPPAGHIRVVVDTKSEGLMHDYTLPQDEIL
jgi:hypothetical protein